MDVPISGSSASEWQSIVIGRAQALISPKLRTFAFDDFTSDGISAVLVSGDGTVTYELPLDGGVANMQTGTTGSAQVQNAGGNIVVADPTARSWFVHSRSQPVIQGGAPTIYHFVGLTSGPDYVALGIDGAFSSTRVYLIKSIGASQTVESTTAELEYVPVGTLDALHEFGIGHDVDTGIIRCLYDGRIVLETTDLTDLTSSPCHAFAFVFNGGELANRQLLVDRIASGTEAAA